ncbi:MAG: BrnT family toxin [Bdellovibrionales bacterium]
MFKSAVKYEWDENKRLSNIEKHGLDFIDSIDVLEAPHILLKSSHREEMRFLAVGRLDEHFVTIIYTLRNLNIRIISFRRARHEEKRKYCELYSSRA